MLLTVRLFPSAFRPSIVTRSAPLSLIIEPATLPDTVRAAPPPGWMVSVKFPVGSSGHWFRAFSTRLGRRIAEDVDGHVPVNTRPFNASKSPPALVSDV